MQDFWFVLNEMESISAIVVYGNQHKKNTITNKANERESFLSRAILFWLLFFKRWINSSVVFTGSSAFRLELRFDLLLDELCLLLLTWAVVVVDWSQSLVKSSTMLIISIKRFTCFKKIKTKTYAKLVDDQQALQIN